MMMILPLLLWLEVYGELRISSLMLPIETSLVVYLMPLTQETDITKLIADKHPLVSVNKTTLKTGVVPSNLNIRDHRTKIMIKTKQLVHQPNNNSSFNNNLNQQEVVNMVVFLTQNYLKDLERRWLLEVPEVF